MTHIPAPTRAYAFELRQLETGAVLGVGLVAPALRYVSLLTEGSAAAASPALSTETWRGIDAWTADGDAGLPRRPAPMGADIVGALIGADAAAGVSTQRFAAIPVTVASQPEWAALVGHVLPGFLRARQADA